MNQASLTIDTEVLIPIKFGSGKFVTFKNADGSACSSRGSEHFAVCFPGYDNESKSPLVRIHSECLTGDIFSSEKCDCGDQLNEALRLLSREGGVLIYLRQEGRGIGLNQKLKAYQLQSQGLDTFAANRALGFENDLRSFDVAAAILKALGISSVKLLTNNPEKEDSLIENNIQVEEVRSTGVFVKTHNFNYLMTKRREAGHRIQFENERRTVNLFPRFFAGEVTC